MEVAWEMAKATGEENENQTKLNFEETELRLGLPVETAKVVSNGGKRGFSNAVDLKLNLHSQELMENVQRKENSHPQEEWFLPGASGPAEPPSKAQVVGWPPIRSFRKNIVVVQKGRSSETNHHHHETLKERSNSNASFVKVSMDGAPYLRKMDLKMHDSYHQLSHALAKMFTSFPTLGNKRPRLPEFPFGSEGRMEDSMNDIKLKGVLDDSEYVPTYKDKDGDWMLVGDVPWGMFVDSCKRLRIMKGTEAGGLAPRTTKKCRNRS